jgi:hypothetical protein
MFNFVGVVVADVKVGSIGRDSVGTRWCLRPRALSGGFIGADVDRGSSGLGAESGELEPSVNLTRL